MHLKENAVFVYTWTRSKRGFVIVVQIACYGLDCVVDDDNFRTICTNHHPLSDVEFLFNSFCKIWARYCFVSKAYVALSWFLMTTHCCCAGSKKKVRKLKGFLDHIKCGGGSDILTSDHNFLILDQFMTCFGIKKNSIYFLYFFILFYWINFIQINNARYIVFVYNCLTDTHIDFLYRGMQMAHSANYRHQFHLV